MVVVMKSTATQEDIEGVKKEMETYGLNMMVSHGDDYTILGAEGNAAAVDQEKDFFAQRCGTGHAGVRAV